MALNTTLIIEKNSKQRHLNLKDFFLGHKKVNLEEGELITKVYFDVPDKNFKFSFEKVGKRQHLDMATVNSALAIKFDGQKIKDASFTVGGLGATVKYLEKTSEFLKGKEITDSVFIEANNIAQTEITPRSRALYKRLLVRQQLFLHMNKISGNALKIEGTLK